jgi:hypothetical protein
MHETTKSKGRLAAPCASSMATVSDDHGRHLHQPLTATSNAPQTSQPHWTEIHWPPLTYQPATGSHGNIALIPTLGKARPALDPVKQSHQPEGCRGAGSTVGKP